MDKLVAILSDMSARLAKLIGTNAWRVAANALSARPARRRKAD